MSQSLRVLVVDDERISRITTAHQLTDAGYEAEAVESPIPALDRLAAPRWDVVLTDLRMPGMDGLQFLREIKRLRPEIDVVLMTAYGSVETAVTAMQEGAADYLTKPFRFAELRLRLERLARARESRTELARLRALLDDTDATGIVGRSPAMQRVRERIALFADQPSPVLVTGETGTGKELVARALHDTGARRGGPFVALACGAIPRELAESTLFGHERGAFTGAAQRRKGCFEQANGGTLLLDDVDDLPADLQVKLLRALQEGTIRRVGAEQEIDVDVRVVATTKVDLSKAVEQGGFRTDLYYRLRGLEIDVPPLRNRGDDVVLLAKQFLRALAGAAGRPSPHLSPDAADALRAHDWPGNVRELRRAMETAAAFVGNDELVSARHLPERMSEVPRSGKLFTLHLEGCSGVELAALVHSFEAEVIGWAMAKAQGQQTRAAELLDVPRTTLQSKLGR